MTSTAAYPTTRAARDRFVLQRRPARPIHDPWQHQGVIVEDERGADGRVQRAVTVLLTGRECPWRCVMCDLWQHTTEDGTPVGAIAAQVAAALDGLAQPWAGATSVGMTTPPRSWTGTGLPGFDTRTVGTTARDGRGVDVVKLYNAGSFFDLRAVPERDHAPIAERLQGVDRVVVESHPSLVGDRVWRFRDTCARRASGAPATRLEVAMGLETAHPDALERLHKRFTLDDFSAAAGRLVAEGVDVRVFLLVGVPFVPREEQVAWVRRSVRTAFACGASVVSLIPTRGGNGAMDALEALGHVVLPTLTDLEEAFDASLPESRGRVLADTWDVERCASCRACAGARRDRLVAMNLAQTVLPRVGCRVCATVRGAA